ncbi:MAG: ribosome assembly RNA-binding protein YhbY [Oligoflexia bacterium]|nr:ribosome assembly RNA-binding protein YhbY [Oligoflexia bacterium]
MPLTGSQRRRLRGLAHHLSPAVLIGGDRLTDGVIAEVDRALTDHELIKIKLIDSDKAEVLDTLQQLCPRADAEHVQTIGHVLVLWRRNPDEPHIPALPGETLKKRPQPKTGRRR